MVAKRKAQVLGRIDEATSCLSSIEGLYVSCLYKKEMDVKLGFEISVLCHHIKSALDYIIKDVAERSASEAQVAVDRPSSPCLNHPERMIKDAIVVRVSCSSDVPCMCSQLWWRREAEFPCPRQGKRLPWHHDKVEPKAASREASSVPAAALCAAIQQ